MSDSRDNQNGGEDSFSWFDESEKFKRSVHDTNTNGSRPEQKRSTAGRSPIFFDAGAENHAYSGKYEYLYPDSSPSIYTDYRSEPVFRGEPISSSGRQPRRNGPQTGGNTRQTSGRQKQKPPVRSGKPQSGKPVKGKSSGKKPPAPKKGAASGKNPSAAKKTAAKKPSGKPPSGSRNPKKGSATGNRPPAKSGKLTRRILTSYFNYLIRKGHSKDEARKIIAKLKKIIRKLKIAAIVFAVLVFALVIALILCFTKGAPIEKIVIDGEKLYSESQILSASGISVGDNMLMIRQKKTNDTITTSLPYIASVKVDYQLPDTLRLVIRETTDKYYVVLDGAYVCIDENDKVVSDVKRTVKGKRYRVEGLAVQDYKIGQTFVPDKENGNKQKYETAKKIAAAIEKAGLKNCTVINVSDPDRIYVVYDGRLWMYLKADSDFEYKMRFVAQALSDSRTADMISASEKSYIDLRLDNQAVFKTGKLS